MDTKQKALQKVLDNPMSAEAWQECGKACEWEGGMQHYDWREVAIKFYKINLTEGWDKAVDWLNNLIN